MNTISLRHVRYLPRELELGILYVSAEYAVAGHLCACGCGNKVITPLGPAEWTFSERNEHPTLSPSIGNWQLPCRSHYIISGGQILWSFQWSETQIAAGRRDEDLRRQAYYSSLERGMWARFWRWLGNLFCR